MVVSIPVPAEVRTPGLVEEHTQVWEAEPTRGRAEASTQDLAEGLIQAHHILRFAGTGLPSQSCSRTSGELATPLTLISSPAFMDCKVKNPRGKELPKDDHLISSRVLESVI